MAIILFSQPDLRGGSFEVTADAASLPAIVRNRLSSVRMTETTDRILFFTRPNFEGDVMLKSGRQDITRMGDPGRGGRNGFGNTVASVRITPITIRTAEHIVTTDGGGFPGNRPSFMETTRYLGEVRAEANRLLLPSMLQLERPGTADVRVIASSRYFNIDLEYVRFLFQSFNVDDRVNVFYVNTLRKASGITAPRCIGNLVGNKIVIDDGSVESRGNTLAHEFGHDLGLTHAEVSNNSFNLMTGTSNLGRELSTAQIEEMQHHAASDRRMSRARQV